MKNRTDKIKLLQDVFTNGNLTAIKNYDMIEIESLLKLPADSLTNVQLEKCLKYLSIKLGKPYNDFSTWSSQQLEARLFELENKLIEHEK